MKKNPLYKQVMDQLKARILAGEFDGKTAFTTEDKIINEYSVSRITAIRALNELESENIIRREQGRGSYVTREAKKFIQMEGDQTAESERPDEKKTVALVLPYHRNFGNMKCIQGIEEVLRENGCRLSVYDAERNVERQAEILRELAKRDVTGVICMPADSREHMEIYSYYRLVGKPILLLDLYVDFLPVRAVVSDNRAGSKALCDYFFDKGHTKIGYIAHGTISGASSVRDRYFGYVDSLLKHDCPVNLDYIEINLSERAKRVKKGIPAKPVYMHSSEEEQFISLREWEEAVYMQYMQEVVTRMHNLGVTAVLCQNDWVALEVAKTCETIGIKTPEQLEIGGFDNVAELVDPERGKYISTVEQDFMEIGRRACRRLLEESVFSTSAMGGIDLIPVKPVLR